MTCDVCGKKIRGRKAHGNLCSQCNRAIGWVCPACKSKKDH